MFSSDQPKPSIAVFFASMLLSLLLSFIPIGFSAAQAATTDGAMASPVSTPPLFTIAAASDLKFALEEIATEFEKQTGTKPRLVFGSSGNFYTQIMQGAPFHLYMSADEVYVNKLHSAGKTVDQGRLYAYGRIGIFVPRNSAVKADSNLDDLAKALEDGRLDKFAIANPDHAPYGERAVQALQHRGIWDRIKPKLVYGENITQAAQFALSGSSQGGIIALSLAKAPAIGNQGHFALIPGSWHQPLAQRMVMIKNSPEQTKLFYTFLQAGPAQLIFKKYGFEMPTEPK